MSKARIEKKEVQKKFWFPLASKDKDKLGKEAGDVNATIIRDTEHLTNLKKEWNAKIDAKQGRLNDILEMLKAGKQFRDVDATEVKDFGKEEIRWMVDGKVFEKRPMTEVEKQTSMPVDPVKSGAAEARLKKEAAAFKNKKHADAAKQIYPGLKVADPEITAVRRSETNRHTKTSAVDA